MCRWGYTDPQVMRCHVVIVELKGFMICTGEHSHTLGSSAG